MKQVTAIIADDEKELRRYLKAKLNQIWPELEIIGEAENGIEAVELAKKYHPDIAFLDIKMPGKSGLDAAEEINSISRIVFITAYDKYAVDAFENEAMDYILKPVEQKRLEKTVHRLKKDLSSDNKTNSDEIKQILNKISENIAGRQENKFLQWIRAQHGDNIRLIPVDEISLFMASDKYTIVISKSGESLIRKTIKELETQLDPEIFWKIHRSTIVKVSSIKKVSRSLSGRYIIKISDYDMPLTVSRTYIHLFKQM